MKRDDSHGRGPAGGVAGAAVWLVALALGCSAGQSARPPDPETGGAGPGAGTGGRGTGGSPAGPGSGGSGAGGVPQTGGTPAPGATGGASGTGGAASGTGGAGDPGGRGGASAADMGAPADRPTPTTPDSGGPAGTGGAAMPGTGGMPGPGGPPGDPAQLPPPPPAPAGWTERWRGDPATTGPGAFEGTETAECTHPGARHFYVDGAVYKMEAHFPADTDCSRTDRQRNEVKGMAAPGGGYVSMKQNETWLITYSMFIPDTLDATTGFTHIHQIFAAEGTTATVGPVVTMSLHDHGGVGSIEMRIDGTSGPHWMPVPLAPIQNRWVTVEFEVKWATAGTFHWTIRDGDRLHVDATRTWNGWHGGERMRPKWGIYRKRDSAGLQNTYMLTAHFRAYSK